MAKAPAPEATAATVDDPEEIHAGSGFGSVRPGASMDDTVSAMEAQMARFMMRFQERMDQVATQITTAVDEKIAVIEARVDNAAVAAQAQQAAGMIPPAVVGGGFAPTPVEDRVTYAQQQAAQRKVAFIPKDDPLNPRSKTFDTWINGNLIRIKRGDVGMLPLGHALDLARSGHGHVIDMTAWSQIPVAPQPDESLPPDDRPVWDQTGMIPRDILRRTLTQ